MAGPASSMHAFETREALAASLAAETATRLAGAVAARGVATLAVSGGTTPALLFDHLSRQAIDWGKVIVTLVDERFVPPDSPRSNEGLVRRGLLKNRAATARLVPLYRPVGSAEEALRNSTGELETLSWPLDVAILGMGTDGHTASFFPDAANLDALLDPTQTRVLALVEAASAGETRLTLTLPKLTSARFLALHIEGGEKRALIDGVLAGTQTPPVAAVLAAAPRPVEIYWAL